MGWWVTVTAMACHALAVSRNKLLGNLAPSAAADPVQTGAAQFGPVFCLFIPPQHLPNLSLTIHPVRKLMTQHLRTCVFCRLCKICPNVKSE